MDGKITMNNEEIIVDIQSDGEGAIPEARVEETEIEIKNSKKNGNKTYLVIYDLLSTVMSAFVMIVLVFTFVFRLVGVSGYSMTNTLDDGDWLLTVQKESYDYGDIVVITQPNYFNEPLIKRVVAKGGDTVDIDFATCTVYVNNEAIEEPYLKESYILKKLDDIPFPYTVPEGQLFCLGDNRNGSTDSRSNLIGSFDERYILGKAVVRIMPFGDFNIYDYE